uniref:Protein NEOXANTHIN-DEFICIENT 1 n=1 Tax=Kalanchoe fedtschenkoi TaxID=63787 RepID=A0A7N0U9Y4_KALFE
MEGAPDKIAPAGYGSPPWTFKGRALYQLHLVKADLARSYIPKDLRLVEAFGYTLGGFFLANYSESPAGIFDELVVIAGIVWNPPTSCAWAARVLVNSDEACSHGRKEVGLPSQVARFSKAVTAIENSRNGKRDGFLNVIGLGSNVSSPENQSSVGVTEVKDFSVADTCDVNLTNHSTLLKAGKWIGLPITMSLPSFSGRTQYNPNLLKYACQIRCRVRAVKPIEVTIPSSSNMLKAPTEEDYAMSSVTSIMLSRPVLALEFNCLEMEVEEPIIVSFEKQ